MGKFAKSENQARKAVEQKVAIGSSRHSHKGDGMIHGIRTSHHYEAALADVCDWLKESRVGHGLPKLTREEAQIYLADRSEALGQNALDQARRALETHLGQSLDRERSEKIETLHSRRYEPEQSLLVTTCQFERNALTSMIVKNAGLRSIEPLTIRPMNEQSPSVHRTWSDERFLNRKDWRPYTVVGKGGLCREVRLPEALSVQLEQRRLSEPRVVRDRGVNYLSYYDIGGGNAWSKSWSDASRRALGWSNGGHGLRHSFAQDRMAEYQAAGYSFWDALELVVEELGHFAPSTTKVYLR